MSRGWIFFWIALFCEGLEWSHGSQSQTGETEETSDELRKRWWFIKTCSGSKPGGHAWNNDWDAHFRFNCPPDQSISSIYSIYRDCKRDRLFEFKCKHTFATGYYGSHCQWTDYLNDFDQPLSYRCPDGQFLAGVESYHQDYQEDRRFKFKCCRHPSHYHVSSCYKTSYVNSRKGVLHYEVPNYHYLVGAESVHSNKEEDRFGSLKCARSDSSWTIYHNQQS